MPTQTFINLEKNKKNKIIDAIINEMMKNSYEYINIANIIREAEIPRGSFYQYFKDKSDLFDYMFIYIGTKKKEFFGNLMQIDTDIPFLDRFLKMYQYGVLFAQSNPKLFSVGRKMLESPYYHQNPLTKSVAMQTKEMFVGMIKKDQDMGRIRKEIDPKILAEMMTDYMINFSIDEVLKENFEVKNVMNAVEQLINILEKGINPNV